MKKGQWSSAAVTVHDLHHEDEVKQHAQIKRRKRAARKNHLSEWTSRICRAGDHEAKKLLKYWSG